LHFLIFWVIVEFLGGPERPRVVHLCVGYGWVSTSCVLPIRKPMIGCTCHHNKERLCTKNSDLAQFLQKIWIFSYGRLLDFVGYSPTMIEWKYHDHDNHELEALWYQHTLASLVDSRPLKFFILKNMVPQPTLLEMLVRFWRPNQQCFKVGCNQLTIEVDDIYLIIGFSWHGIPNILSCGPGVSDLSISDYIA